MHVCVWDCRTFLIWKQVFVMFSFMQTAVTFKCILKIDQKCHCCCFLGMVIIAPGRKQGWGSQELLIRTWPAIYPAPPYLCFHHCSHLSTLSFFPPFVPQVVKLPGLSGHPERDEWLRRSEGADCWEHDDEHLHRSHQVPPRAQAGA